MVDIAGLGGSPTAADFEFKVGNSADPSTWADAPAPSSITVFPGAGIPDSQAVASDRITIIWPDNAIEKQWLQVTILVTANTALAEPHVFYFGNAVGDSGSGNTATYAFVTVTDELAARNHAHNFLNRALVSDPCDYNKDSFVTVTDELLSRNHGTNFLNALKLFTAPGGAEQGGGMTALGDRDASGGTWRDSDGEDSQTATSGDFEPEIALLAAVRIPDREPGMSAAMRSPVGDTPASVHYQRTSDRLQARAVVRDATVSPGKPESPNESVLDLIFAALERLDRI
jgi:hypothetical protein